MRNLLTRRKRIIIAGATAALVLGTGGAAFAYFTNTGSGTGSATVGSPGGWGVQQTASTGGPLYPGAGTVVLTFTITNNGSGNQEFTNATPSVPAFGTTADAQTGSPATDIPGCTAGWFSAVIDPSNGDPGINTSIPTGGTTTIKVDVTMNDKPVDQGACKGATPNISLSVS